jgi:hypothetical protein
VLTQYWPVCACPALGCPVVIAFVHPYGKLSPFYMEGEYERLVPRVGEARYDRVSEQAVSALGADLDVSAELMDGWAAPALTRESREVTCWWSAHAGTGRCGPSFSAASRARSFARRSRHSRWFRGPPARAPADVAERPSGSRVPWNMGSGAYLTGIA